MNRPLLHVYLTTWQNQEVIKDTITWYRNAVPDCKITVYDNMSTDLTSEMCAGMDCKVISFNTGGEMNEAILMQIRELGWLNPEDNSHIVITCDDDEMILVTPELLKNAEWNVCHCEGFELFGNPNDSLDDMRFGLPSIGYSKKIMWKRDEIQKMNFGAGSHNANPTPNSGYEIKYNSEKIPLYHTKWARGWEKGVARQKAIAPRVDSASQKQRRNFHFGLPDYGEPGTLNHWNYFSEGFKNRIKVR